MIELTEKRCSDGACACCVEPLAHPRYSFGMLLEARHLALEHRYGALRMNTHDIRLHDFGTVCGLRVDKHPSPECVDRFAILRPGIALDCCGREIVVPEDLYVPLYDGARSGWCGGHVEEPKPAAKALPAGTPPPPHPAVLYIYLRYRECETDPIPTYVRECGCCTDDCEHGSCVPSVIREGYEVFVSTTPPRPWRNPVATAFCTWLESRIKGPGASPYTYALRATALDDALCAVITEPCADLCELAGDALLLATVSFDAKGALTGIDNCTDRRLVVSTGALFGAIECLAVAVAGCCKKKAYLTLAGTVVPATVNVEQPPATPELTYTVTVANADATDASGPFTVQLAFPPGLQFGSATFVVDGATQPPPTGDASGVKANVASLAAGKTATLTVVAKYDPAQHTTPGTIVATASIPTYDGDHGPPVTLTTTFVDIPIPRVVTGNLPTTLTTQKLDELLRSMPGIVLPFTTEMNPTSAVANDPKATVSLEAIQDGVVVAEAPLKLQWFDPKTLHVFVDSGGPLDAIGAFIAAFTQKPAQKNVLRILLRGGPDGSGPSGAALIATDGMRLDGEPATGGPFAGESGNGTQGGDFTWDIPIEVPVELDGPHVDYAISRVGDVQLPDAMLLNATTLAQMKKGFLIAFDEPMDVKVPAKPASPASVKLTVASVQIKIRTSWSGDMTLRVLPEPDALESALKKLANSGGTMTLTISGGPKNAPPTGEVLRSADATRVLDGAPAKGSGPLQAAGNSGDGHQGGDFVWPITLSIPDLTHR